MQCLFCVGHLERTGGLTGRLVGRAIVTGQDDTLFPLVCSKSVTYGRFSLVGMVQFIDPGLPEPLVMDHDSAPDDSLLSFLRVAMASLTTPYWRPLPAHGGKPRYAQK